MNKLLCFMIVLLFINSCKKEENKGSDIVLKGRILNAKDSSAFGNTSFMIYQAWRNLNNREKEKSEAFTTDVNGYFYLHYKSRHNIITLRWPAGRLIADAKFSVSTPEEYDFGTQYTTPK